MLKTKKRFFSLLVILSVVTLTVVPSAQKNARADETYAYDDLYIEALEKEETGSFYKTTTVRKGTFSIYFTTMPRTDYNDYSNLINPIGVGTVTLEHFEAKLGDWLEIGEPVCYVSVKVDEGRIAELEAEIRKDEDMLSTYAYTCEELLDDYDRRYQKGGPDGELAKLLYDRLKLEYDEEVKARRETIDALQSEYDALRMAQVQTMIPAIAPGFVAHLETLRRGMVLEPYAFIGVMYRTDNARLVIDKGSEYLRYGLKTTIVQNDGSRKVEADGMVVTSLNTSLPPALVGDENLIALDDESVVSEFNPRKDIVLKAERVHMENALMVKNTAVYDDSHGQYVLVDVNGQKTRKYVVTGGSNADDTWIINGVNEGDTVIIK